MSRLVTEGVRVSSVLFGQETPASAFVKQGSSLVPVSMQGMAAKRPTSFTSGYPNGGGTASGSCSPLSKGLMLYGVDTSGPRWSLDGGYSSRFITLGLQGGISQRQSPGSVFSTTVDGTAFYVTGDGTASKGGVYVVDNLGTPWAVSKPRRIDGVAAGSPKLVFQGSNNTDARMGPTGGYPRWYSRVVGINDRIETGVAHIFVATYGLGLHRIRYRYSDTTVLSQDIITGSENLLIRWVCIPTDHANLGATPPGGIIFTAYDVSSGGTPAKPRRCDNPYDTSGAALTSAELSNLPTNLDGACYLQPAGAGVVPLTVFVGTGYVGLSTNAFTAVPGSVTATNTARTVAQNDGPETTEPWIAVGGDSEAGFNYVLVGAADGGRTIGSGSSATYATAYVGKVSATASNPASSIAWTRLDGPSHWSENLMNDPARPGWLSGVNTPGLSGTSTISGFFRDPLTPGRIFAVCKGAIFRTDDHGYHWYPIRGFGSADHNVIKSDAGAYPGVTATTTGDWPFVVTLPNPGQEPFVDVEPTIVVAASTYAMRGCFSDPITGDWFVGSYFKSTGAGHSVPDSNAGNGLQLVTVDKLGTAQDSAALIDLKLNTGGTAVAGVHDGICLYGSAVTGQAGRTVIVATAGGGGLWWSKNVNVAKTGGTPTWTKLVSSAGSGAALQPYATAWAGDTTCIAVDRARGCAYFFDRGGSTLWCVKVASDGTPTATPIAYATGGIAVSRDSCGYVAVDPDTGRAYFSTKDNVWGINSPSTAPAITTSSGLNNAFITGFQTYYPGELVGPIGWSRFHKALTVQTLGYSDGNGTSPYPRNGSDGPRALFVIVPDVTTQWAPDVATDFAVAADRGYRTAYALPKTVDIDPVGVRWQTGAQGSGVGCFFLPLTPMFPVADIFAGSTLSSTRWPSTAGSPTINQGAVRLLCTTAGSSAYTAYVFDLRDTPVTVGLRTLPNAGNGGTKTELWVRAQTAAKQLKFSFTGDLSQVVCTGSGFSDQSFTVAPAARRHLRFRLSDDKASVLWEVSTDRLVWNTLRTEPTPAWLVSERLRAMLSTSYTGTEPTPGYAEFDRFNA